MSEVQGLRCILVWRWLHWFWSGTDPNPSFDLGRIPILIRNSVGYQQQRTNLTWLTESHIHGTLDIDRGLTDAPYICDCIQLWILIILMQWSHMCLHCSLYAACIQCWYAQFTCIKRMTMYSIRHHISRLRWPQLRRPWHVEAGPYCEHYVKSKCDTLKQTFIIHSTHARWGSLYCITVLLRALCQIVRLWLSEAYTQWGSHFLPMPMPSKGIHISTSL